MGLSDGSNFSRLKPESPDRPVVLLDGTDAGRRSEVSMMGDECIGGGVSDGMTHTILQVRKKVFIVVFKHVLSSQIPKQVHLVLVDVVHSNC